MKLPRDSMIAYIPLNVTADLGVAMKRVRAKRISKLRQLFPTLFQTDAIIKKKNVEDDNDEEDEDMKSQKSKEEEDSEPKQEKSSSNNAAIRREQFGSIVEYLEAKYAKGVMIDDLDERIRERKKKKKNQEKGDDNATSKDGKDATKTTDDMSVLSDSAAGSCYSNESGNFIDDSELRNEVAHQILGSSAYGKTKIEATAKSGAEEDNSIVGDDDHGFFVNIGDLEMEDGWMEHDLDEDEDWMKMMAKAKG